MPSEGEVPSEEIAGEGEGARAAEQVARDAGMAPSPAPIPLLYPNLQDAEVRYIDPDPHLFCCGLVKLFWI